MPVNYKYLHLSQKKRQKKKIVIEESLNFLSHKNCLQTFKTSQKKMAFIARRITSSTSDEVIQNTCN